MSLSTPTQITAPFANTGTRAAIPQAANNVTGRAGYDLGFPPVNLMAKSAGGIPPFGQDMNGILYDITLAEQFIQAGGSWPYNSAFATAIGGYPLGALVQRSDGSGFWRNTVANNTTNPDAGGANWVPEYSGSTSVAMSNANVTLTSLQAAKSVIIITGAVTANLNLIFPDYSKTWSVINNSTGNFTITCKTASGAGVVLRSGSVATVTGNGAAGIFYGFAASLGASGWQKLPSGLIIQWGTAVASSSADVAVVFPLAFPAACRSISIANASMTSFGAPGASGPPTTTGFNLVGYNGAGRVAISTFWTAIGD